MKQHHRKGRGRKQDDRDEQMSTPSIRKGRDGVWRQAKRETDFLENGGFGIEEHPLASDSLFDEQA